MNTYKAVVSNARILTANSRTLIPAIVLLTAFLASFLYPASSARDNKVGIAVTPDLSAAAPLFPDRSTVGRSTFYPPFVAPGAQNLWSGSSIYNALPFYVNGLLAISPTLSDDFNDNSLDTTKWTVTAPTSPAVVSEQGQQLRITLPTDVLTYNSIVSNATYDMRGSTVQVEVVQSVSQAGSVENLLSLELDAQNYYLIDTGAGNTLFRSMVNGVKDELIVPYDPAAHRYWRVRHDQSTNAVSFETSADGVAWASRKTVAAGFALTAMRFSLIAGVYGPGNSSPGAAVYDNFQFIPSASSPLIADDFNDNSLDRAKWDANNLFSGFTDTSVPINETLQKLEIGPLPQNTGQTNGDSHYRGVRTVNTYNFTGAYSYVELAQAAPTSTKADAMFTIGNNVDNYYRLYVSNGSLIGQRKVGGTKSQLFTLPYDTTNHRFLRIRHDAATGKLTLDTATGSGGVPGSWVQRYSEAWHPSISLTGIILELKAGTWQPEATAPGKVIFDNFQFGSNSAPVANPPTVTAISPNSGSTSGGTSVTITGTGFSSGATVTLGGSFATNVTITILSGTSLTATTPAHVSGPVNVVVTNTDGQFGILNAGYTYVSPPASPPTVTAIAPNSGSTSGGTSVTITGTGFSSGATVSLNGSFATNVTVVSSTSITATTPARSAGPVNVVVTRTDGQSGTLPNGYTYISPQASPPTVTAISPNSGSTSGGTSVTITGTGFSSGATVSLNGSFATNVTVVSSTSITATTPARSAGPVDVVVTRTDGQFGTLPNGYTYISNSSSEAILLADDFNDNSLDTAKWDANNLFSGFTDTRVPINETLQKLEIGPLPQNTGQTNGDTHYRGVRTVNNYNFTGAYSYVELAQAATASTKADAMFTIGNNVDNYYRLYVNNGSLIGLRKSGGVKTTLFTLPYDTTNHRFLRIRHDAFTGKVMMDTATGSGGVPGSWVQRYSEAWNSSISLTGMILEIKGGTWQPEATAPGKVIFDNFKAAIPTSEETSDAVSGTGAPYLERLDPMNRTGGGIDDPLSRNFNWTLPLLSLRGRAGMDLGLSLSYNSLIWLKSGGNTISFDDDRGFPAPGFRLGFPVIKQPSYFNSQVGKNALLLLSPDGSRTELRQVGTSSFYEAADSSYLMFDSSKLILYTSDGTQLSYSLMGPQYNCTQIKDRNGNYLTVTYDAGYIKTITDTLGRIINFNYTTGFLLDQDFRLLSITQVWNQGRPDEVTHYWARFAYNHFQTIKTNFPGLTVAGPPNGSEIEVLSRITLADGSNIDFSYTFWGQVWKVSSFAPDGHVLNYRSYNLPETSNTALTDCPRFTQRRDWAQYMNGDTDGTPVSSEEVITNFAEPVSDSWTMPDNTVQKGIRAQLTRPDGTSDKLYFVGTAGSSFGWQRGLPALVNTYDSSGKLQRQVMTTWTQNNTALSYPDNPRVIETNVYDPAGNRSRTQVTYKQFTFANGTSCHFPEKSLEYAADASTILRSTRTTYNESAAYTGRRILALVSDKEVYDGDINNGGTLMSKISFNFDESGSIQGTDAPAQHDTLSFDATFLAGRGNLSSVKRFDVTNLAPLTIATIRYNTSGAVVSSIDASNHETKISYADSFSDGKNTTRKTFAYPTSVTDADLNTVTAIYNFDFGAVTEQQTPRPSLPTYEPGPRQALTYDVIGRLERITSLTNSAYTRFEYSPSQNRVDTYATIQEGQGEAHYFEITDGHGRVIANATRHPGGVDLFNGRKMIYDKMGRLILTSNPAETSAIGPPSQWTAADPDDTSLGWIYTEQTYDWKGRPLITINPSVTSNPNETTTKQASYAGCGCAGGEIVTLTDEMNRKQKVYSDVLGRPWKTEVLNWDGTVYSTNVSVYNARDQITTVKHYGGLAPAEASSTNASASCPTGTCQETALTFDGHARLKTKHLPQQQIDPNNAASRDRTSWTYNADDTIKSETDARGVIANYLYNKRHLLTSIIYVPPSNIANTPEVRFAYDAAGNRTSMTDGSGSVEYQLNSLSQIASETRKFIGLSGQYTIGYEYNLAGELKKLTYSNGATVDYTFDSIGRTRTVNSNLFAGAFQYVTDIQYRASGDRKKIFYGNDTQLELSYNSRLQLKRFNVKNHLFQGERSDMKLVDFQYHADGSLSSAADSTDPRFSRIYNFDHVGRLTQDGSGVYNQIYQYNAFGNVTNRLNVMWSSEDWFAATYVNGRNQSPQWKYDADGNITFDDKNELKYDASGVNTSVRSLSDNQTVSQIVDGDGELIKRTPSAIWLWPIYYLRSTVLDGSSLTEIHGEDGQLTGKLSKHYLYLDDEVLATINDGNVFWQHENPLTGAVSESVPQGFYGPKVEPDSMGVNVGFEDPFAEPPSEPREPDIAAPNPFAGSGECRVEGILFSCVAAGRLLAGGSAVRCPNGDCGAIRVRYQGKPDWAFFQAFGDEYAGYVPSTARYIGKGAVAPAASSGRPTLGRYGRTKGDTDLGRLNGARGSEDDLAYTGLTGGTFVGRFSQELSGPRPQPPLSADECRARALKTLAAELESRKEIFPDSKVFELAKILLMARAGGVAGASAGTAIMPGPGTVSGAVVGGLVGGGTSVFVSSLAESRIEAGPVDRFMATINKGCAKTGRLEARQPNAMQAAPEQIFVITRHFGTFALYPYTIMTGPTLLGDYIYTTYGRNPLDPVKIKRGYLGYPIVPH